jgi:small-conductance mechanosensitive channel
MIAATVIGVLLLMAAAWPLSMSPEIFDSGQSAETWSIFIAIWLMPVALLAGIAIGWIGFSRNARRVVITGLVLAALPVLAAIGILAMAGV